jgi:hypothetical protein
MLEAFGDDSKRQRLDAGDGLIAVGAVAHITPDRSGISASHRPSCSFASSIAKVSPVL